VIRIKSEDLQVGKPLPWDCYDAGGVLLLRKGVVIASQRQLDGVIERGLFADQEGHKPAAQAPSVPAEKPSPFHIIADIKLRLRAIFTGIITAQTTDLPGRIIKLCKDLQDLCEMDADAALGTLHLDHEGRYTIIHPLHVAILCELIAKRKGVAAEPRLSLLAAAITSNIAMIELQDTLQKQQTPLNPEQLEAIRLHTLKGVDMLLAAGVQDDVWIRTVLHHHEKLDGSGYPGALRGDDIPLPVRILSLADTYSAMITPRVYRNQILASDALRDIFLKRGAEMDAALAQVFIKEMGVFPPGAFVKLHNGEVAVVIRRGDNAMAPLVQSLIGPRGAPLPVPVPLRRDSSKEDYAIREMVCPDKTASIDPHLLWGYK